MRAFVGVEAQLFAVPPIDVCQAIRGWVASGYKTIPGQEESPQPHGVVGRAWQRALRVIRCGGSVRPIQKTLLAVLQPYERPGSRLTTRRIAKMETRLLAAFEISEGHHLEALWRVLGLPPLWRRRVKEKLATARPLPDCSILT